MSDPRLGNQLRARRHEQRNRRDPVAPLRRNEVGLLELALGPGLVKQAGLLTARTLQVAVARWAAFSLVEGSNTPGAGDYYLTAEANKVPVETLESSSTLGAVLTDGGVSLPPGEYMLLGLFTVENANAGSITARMGLTNADGSAIYDTHTAKPVFGSEFAPTNMVRLLSLATPATIFLRGAKAVGTADPLQLDRGYLVAVRLGEAV